MIEAVVVLRFCLYELWFFCQVRDEVVSNHDELMSNFFAQPDALALGKTGTRETIEFSFNHRKSLANYIATYLWSTEAELVREHVPAALIPHKVFSGNRPSSSLLIGELNAYTTGTVVQDLLWDYDKLYFILALGFYLFVLRFLKPTK